MIDPNLFTVEKLLKAIIDNKWRELAEIIPEYIAPFAREGDKPKCVVRMPKINEDKDRYYSFLRYSVGPKQHYFWDIYGDNFLTPELALLALAQAPIPPHFVGVDVWRAVRDAEVLARM